MGKNIYVEESIVEIRPDRKAGAPGGREMVKLKITEANGTVWYDNTTWVEAPDQEDCEREYNPGCTIEIEDSEGNEIDIITT